MRIRTVVLGFVAFFCLSVVASSTADAARRDALEESELIRDKDDVFLYPQLAVDYSNMLSFEYGNSATTGNALLLFGSEAFSAGVAVHRGDLFKMAGFRGGPIPGLTPGNLSAANFQLTPTNSFPYRASDDLEVSDPDSPLSGAGQFQGLHTMFDLMAGIDLGAGKAGARLSLGVGGQSVNPADDDASSEGEFALLFRGGYSGTFGDLELDSALSFVFNTGDNNNLASGADSTGSVVGFGVEGRMYNEFTDETSLGALLDVGVSSTNITNEAPDPDVDASLSSFMIQAGAGPVFTIGGDDQEATRAEFAQFGESDDEDDDEASETTRDDESSETATDANQPAQSEGRRSAARPTDEDDEGEAFDQSAEIAGYGVLGFSSISHDPDDDTQNDEISASATIVPGFHLAGEYHVLKWLYLRSGAQYWFATFGTRQETDDGPNEAGFDNHQFGWSAGLGVEAGQFRFDGSFNKGFLRAGPQFIGGNASGLFGSVSAQYAW